MSEGNSEASDVFRFFFKYTLILIINSNAPSVSSNVTDSIRLFIQDTWATCCLRFFAIDHDGMKRQISDVISDGRRRTSAYSIACRDCSANNNAVLLHYYSVV